jgi:hypothetical protein
MTLDRLPGILNWAKPHSEHIIALPDECCDDVTFPPGGLHIIAACELHLSRTI